MVMGCLCNFLARNRRSSSKAVVAVDRGCECAKRETDFDYKDEEEKGQTGCVRKYNWNEIETLTVNFSQVIGSGGFSTVFLANLPGSDAAGAIKIHCAHLSRLFNQELDILLRLRHQNIVKLLGYCLDQEEGALVFEYVPNGNLQEKLHGGTQISWRRRMAIAFQLAQTLEYLHEKCSLQIVHGDIKASNVLLDEDMNCKLCDFGSAKMGFSSSVVASSRAKQLMMGSPGYTDPHYLRTGIPSKKNDVYSFGVIVLELVTGIEAFCEEKGQMLTSIVGPMLGSPHDHECETMKVAEMVDPRLAGDFDPKEAKAMLSLAALCLGHSPTLRPSATQILDSIKDNISSLSVLFSPQKHLLN